MTDTNAVIRAYLVSQTAITDLVSTRIYCPRLPENATLPAIGFFTRGGSSDPYIPPIVDPSVQIDCWAANSIDAREVYRAVYDSLQGIQNVNVTIGADTFKIKSVEEEVQGQDLQDEIPGYFRVLCFFKFKIA